MLAPGQDGGSAQQKKFAIAALAAIFAGTMLASPAEAAERQDGEAIFNSKGASCNSLEALHAAGKAPNTEFANANAVYDLRGFSICLF